MLIAGVILVITIPFWLTPVEQGFFFFFYSIISLQVMCELGLNQIIMQRLSACYSNLSIDEDNLLSGLPEDIGDFHTILTAAKTWYRNIAIFFYIAGLSVGSYILKSSSDQSATEQIVILALLLTTVAINLYLSIQLTARQATSRVADVARLRTFQSVCGNIIFLVLVFILKIKMEAILAISFTSCVLTYVWLKKNSYHYSVEPIINSEVNWITDFFPLQWRIAVTWISGYVVTQLLVLFIFSEHGPVISGKFGLTISIFTSIIMIGLSIVMAKMPEMARLISLRSYDLAFRLFRGLLISALILAGLSMTTFILIVINVSSDYYFLTDRILDQKLMIIIAISNFGSLLIFAIGAYLRAHDKEPTLNLSVALLILVLLNMILSSGQSIEFFLKGHASINLIGVPWALWLLIKQAKSYELRS